MNDISKAIFRAIHEGKWLQIEYRNRDEKLTKFWIGILDLNVKKRTLSVDGLHIVQGSLERYDVLYIDAVISARVIDGSYQKKNENLIQDIKHNPEKYKGLFDNAGNLKILNYLAECNRLDAVPYYTNYDLLRFFDGDNLKQQSAIQGSYSLTQEQYHALIRQFTVNLSQKNKIRNIELGLNI